MDVAILMYDRFTALDAIGPYQVLCRVPGADVSFVSAAPGLISDDTGSLTVSVERALADARQPDIVVIPGGPGEVAARAGGTAVDWVRDVHATTTWTTSVCTGSLILGAAGLLKGLRATTHWLAIDELRTLGAEPVTERVVVDEAHRIITAAGVSSGIDMGLTLAARLAGDRVAQAIQLGIEYDPQPPFDAGSPRTAPPEIVEFLRSRSRFPIRSG